MGCRCVMEIHEAGDWTEIRRWASQLPVFFRTLEAGTRSMEFAPGAGVVVSFKFVQRLGLPVSRPLDVDFKFSISSLSPPHLPETVPGRIPPDY